jgi:hypothetical protein
VKLDGLHLYGVTRGDVRSSPNGWGEDAFIAVPIRPAPEVICTALWRGWIAHFVLQEDGCLRLMCFRHMVEIGEWQEQPVDELIAGDFWVVMKPDFDGLRTYIPFRRGRVVEDRSEWFTERPFHLRGRPRRSKGES